MLAVPVADLLLSLSWCGKLQQQRYRQRESALGPRCRSPPRSAPLQLQLLLGALSTSRYVHGVRLNVIVWN